MMLDFCRRLSSDLYSEINVTGVGRRKDLLIKKMQDYLQNQRNITKREN